ncbi:MAG: hypothetical protein ACM31P_17585 [Actinomycetota bacterium]
MNKKLLIDVIGIILIGLVVVVGYKLSPLLLQKADVTVQPAPGCDLQRAPCEATLPGGGTVRFSITPRPIPMVAPLQLEAEVTGREASKVEVDFAGVDMNMGLNRPQLQAAGGGRFTGQGTLPVCVTGTMDWQATLVVETDRERIAVPFRFVSNHK